MKKNKTLTEDSRINRKEDRRIFLLREEKPSRAVLKLGIPLIAGMMVMALYNLTDTWFIGQLHDDYQLAAVNMAYPVMMIMIAVSNMVGTGAASLIARCLGASDLKKACHTLTAGIVLTVINSAVVTGAGFLFLPEIVNGLGAEANTWVYTRQYVAVLLIGSLGLMGNYTFGQLLRSEGSVSYSMTGMIAGTVANIVLDPVFIFGFGMEISGAAIATVLSNAIAALISLQFYVRRKTLLQPSIRYMKPTVEILREIFWVGVPATMETLLTSAAYVVNNNLAVQYGALTVAATGISQKILSLGSYIYQGFSAGIQPLMGYNFGARNYRRMLQVLRAGLLIVSGTELCLMAVYGLTAPALVGLFSQSEEVIRTGSIVLRAMMWILPFVGAVSMSRISFQAMGKPQYAFGITVVRQLLLYIPLLFLLNRQFGFRGLIRAQPLTELIMMIASVALLYRFLKRLQKAGNGSAFFG